MHSAMPAEGVLRRVGVELVGREFRLAPQQLELLRRDDQMQDALLCAHRAVAFEECRQVGSHAELHLTAMAATLIGFHHFPGSPISRYQSATRPHRHARASTPWIARRLRCCVDSRVKPGNDDLKMASRVVEKDAIIS